jgi:hypothetical protein
MIKADVVNMNKKLAQISLAMTVIFALTNCGQERRSNALPPAASKGSSEKPVENLTGGKLDESAENSPRYTSYTSEAEADAVRNAIPLNPANIALASQVELQYPEATDDGKIKIQANLKGSAKPLEFVGDVKPVDGHFEVELTDQSDQKSPIKISGSCSDAKCKNFNANLVDGDQTKIGIVARQEESNLSIVLPEGEKLPKNMDQESKELFAKWVKGSRVKVDAMAFYPGPSKVEITEAKPKLINSSIKNNQPLKISAALLETNGDGHEVKVGGVLAKHGKLYSIGNSQNGTLLYDFEANKEDVDKGMFPSSFLVSLKKIEQSNSPVKTSVATEALPIKKAGAVASVSEQKKLTPVKIGSSSTNSSQVLLNQILADCSQKLVQIKITQLAKESQLYHKAGNYKIMSNFLKLYSESLRSESTDSNAKDFRAVREVISQKNLPQELIFITYIESGFNKNTECNASSCGLWQLEPGTARENGITVDFKTHVDQRREIIPATKAAANYINTLLTIFKNDIGLALGAYNTGDGSLKGSQKRQSFKDGRSFGDPRFFAKYPYNFWELNRLHAINPITAAWVPTVYAGICSKQNPEANGFPGISFEPMSL